MPLPLFPLWFPLAPLQVHPALQREHHALHLQQCPLGAGGEGVKAGFGAAAPCRRGSRD